MSFFYISANTRTAFIFSCSFVKSDNTNTGTYPLISVFILSIAVDVVYPLSFDKLPETMPDVVGDVLGGV